MKQINMLIFLIVSLASAEIATSQNITEQALYNVANNATFPAFGGIVSIIQLNNETLTIASEFSVKVLSLNDSQVIRDIQITNEITSMILLNDSRTLAVSTERETVIRFINPFTGNIIRNISTLCGPAESLVTLSNGLLASGGNCSRIQIWDPFLGDLIKELNNSQGQNLTFLFLFNNDELWSFSSTSIEDVWHPMNTTTLIKTRSGRLVGKNRNIEDGSLIELIDRRVLVGVNDGSIVVFENLDNFFNDSIAFIVFAHTFTEE